MELEPQSISPLPTYKKRFADFKINSGRHHFLVTKNTRFKSK